MQVVTTAAMVIHGNVVMLSARRILIHASGAAQPLGTSQTALGSLYSADNTISNMAMLHGSGNCSLQIKNPNLRLWNQSWNPHSSLTEKLPL
jgi:hypothetical protein